MSDLISRKAVIDWFRCYGHMDEPIPFETLVSDLRDAIPSVDAAPVVHGRWMSVDIFGEDPYSCSECGNGVNVYGYDFCPSCGMPMTDRAIEILKKRMDGADNE